MCSMDGTNSLLKLLRNVYCMNCNGQFQIRDLPSKGPKCPILMKCGHSICESCIYTSLKNKKSVFCQECHIMLLPGTEGQNTESFPMSLYLLGGTVAVQSHKYENERKLALLTKDSVNFNYKLIKQPEKKTEAHSSKGVCEECSLSATWYCENCKSNFCNVCWDTVHGSAKSLKKHSKTALSIIERGGLKKCPKHETQELEFFCMGCATTICCHCVILLHQGEEHSVITLKEKNKDMVNSLKFAAEGAEKAKKRMKQTLEKIKMYQNAGALDYFELMADFEKQIQKNFARLHGLLQLEEERCLMKLREGINDRQAKLTSFSTQLETQIEHTESLLNEYLCSVEKPQYCNPTELHGRLKEVEKWPCYLICGKDNAAKNFKISFDGKFTEYIRNYCSINVTPNELFELRSNEELQQDHAVESVKDSDSRGEVKPGTSRSEGETSMSEHEMASSSSSRDTISGDPNESSPSWETFCENKSYTVRVTFIKNPGEFYVMLFSQTNRYEALEKKVNQLANCSPIPWTLRKDDIFLVKYDVDKKWYRGRIVERSAQVIDGEETVVVFFLDCGRTETVPLSRMRIIPKELLEQQPFVVKCKLFDCVPREGQWCDESTKTMDKIVGNYAATLYLMKIEQDHLEVDLSVAYPESPFGRDIVSVRDTLLFLEFSSFVNGPKITQNPTAMKYLPQVIPSLGQTLDAVLTFVNSPSDFYVQDTEQDVEFLCNLTDELQEYYDENSQKGIIYNPVIGMPCVALFSMDKKWYRAKIIDIPGKKMVTVYYVDYGNIETLPWLQVRKLKESFVKKPPAALNCSLAGIYPAQSEWSKEANAYMNSCILERGFRVQISFRPKNKQKVKVLLYHTLYNKEICVNTMLVEIGEAVRSTPISVSTLNAQEQDKGVFEPSSTSALEEEQPSKEQRARNFMERRKGKLNAKKLRELHEYEKRFRPVQQQELVENEIDLFDSVFKVKVDVLSAESPSVVYVTFPNLMAKLGKLQSLLNDFYKDTFPFEAKAWKVGSLCAVFDTTRCNWYRAEVVGVLENNYVRVFLKDIAQFTTESVLSLRELDPSFMDTSCCAVRCHLADIGPPGDEWPTTSSELLQRELELHQEVYMTKRGPIENYSLPIELWVKRVVRKGALEPNAKEWVILNKHLVSQGVAIPQKSKLWYLDEEALVGKINFDSDSSDSGSGDKGLSSDDGHLDAYIPKLSRRWLPPEPVTRGTFSGTPTYIDSRGSVFIQNTERDEKILKIMRETLSRVYKNSEPEPENYFWSPGQICIAQYHMDKLWYRGIILKAKDDLTYDVFFVDYGNIENCKSQDLRKKLIFQNIPVMMNKFKLDGIEPVSRVEQWPEALLEIMHSLLVDKECEVKVLETSADPAVPCRMNLKLVKDDVDIGQFLAEQGLVVMIRPSTPLSIESDTSTDSKKTDLKKKFESPFKLLNVPFGCNGFHIKVGDLTGENEFFANIINSDSLSPALKDILMEFANLEENLMIGCQSQTVIDHLVRGAPCCCLNPENKWCRAEIIHVCSTDPSARVLFVDYGTEGSVDKKRIHECKAEWMTMPKMALKFRISHVKRNPNVSKSLYKRTLKNCLSRPQIYAEIVFEQEGVVEVRLLTHEKGLLLYQDMLDKHLMFY